MPQPLSRTTTRTPPFGLHGADGDLDFPPPASMALRIRLTSTNSISSGFMETNGIVGIEIQPQVRPMSAAVGAGQVHRLLDHVVDAARLLLGRLVARIPQQRSDDPPAAIHRGDDILQAGGQLVAGIGQSP